jgi:hypothetical protein
MFWLFNGKKRLEEINEETKKGFEMVKKDMVSITEWIKHLDSEKKSSKKEIEFITIKLKSLEEEMEGLKNIFSLQNSVQSNKRLNKVFTTNTSLFDKQTTDYEEETPIQTGVQTPNLSNFSITERAILFVLLNSDLKLSYDDLATMLNKEKSTIRGQINTIKSKSESLIKEEIEKNGKKRIYISEEMKEKLLKKQKVREKKKKK